jgi:hypothetical protein
MQRLRVRRTKHDLFWLEEKIGEDWLIVDSFLTYREAEAAAKREAEGQLSWVEEPMGYRGRVRWTFKNELQVVIWDDPLRSSGRFVLEENRRELSCWDSMQMARIALLVRRNELGKAQS